MKNKYKYLIAILTITAILGLLLFLIKSGVFEHKHIEDEGNDDPVYVDIDTNDVSSVCAFSCDMSGEKLEFVISEGKWQVKGKECYPIDVNTPTTMLNSLSEIKGYRLIAQNCTNLAEYGLDRATYTISLMFSDGSTKTYLFGDYNDYAGAYYFTIGGTGNIYTLVDKITTFCNDKFTDMIVRDEFPVMPDADDVISVAVGDKTINEGDEGASELFEAVCSSSLGSVCGAGSEELAKLGYGSAKAVTVTYKVNTAVDGVSNEVTTESSVCFFAFMPENAEEDQTIYATVEGSELAYELTGEGITALISYL